MTRIMQINIRPGIGRIERTPKGNTYHFDGGLYTEVKDPEDALHFLNACGGKVFKAEKATDKIKKGLKKTIDTLTKKKEVDEANPPEETGALEPTDEDLKDDAPIDGEDVKEKAEDPGPVGKDGKEEKNVLTEAGIKALIQPQQEYLIKKCKGDNAAIPRYEKDRVKLLFKLQKQGKDLVDLLKSYSK